MARPDPRTRRYPCPWCTEPRAWPDRCGMFCGDDLCADETGQRCALGDHRRCDGSHCPVAARWLLAVRRAGVLAAEPSGAIWAVVSIIGDRVTVVGTEDHLGRAKSLLRTGHLKRCGWPIGPVGKGAVYVVRASDAELF